MKVIATAALGAACNRAALGRPLYVVAAVKSPVVAQSLLVERALIDALRLRSFKASISTRLRTAALSHAKNEGSRPGVTPCGFPVRLPVRPPVPPHSQEKCPMTFEPSGKSGRKRPWEGPRDGASAELETSQSLSSDTPSSTGSNRSRISRDSQILKKHDAVPGDELKVVE